MGHTAQLADEFAKRNVKPLGLSTDEGMFEPAKVVLSIALVPVLVKLLLAVARRMNSTTVSIPPPATI